MRQRSGLIIALTILVLPLLTWLLLRTGKHKLDEVAILSPKVENPGGSPDSVYKTIGDFSFTSQTGSTITQDSLRGNVYVADVFFSTCPGICPKLSAALSQVHEKFKDTPGLKLLSITVDPETDSVPVLAEYAARYGANPNKWYFVTGEKQKLYKFANGEFFFRAMEDPEQKGELQFIHDNTVRLIDREGRMRGKYYDGTDPKDVDSLLMDVNRLLRSYVE